MGEWNESKAGLPFIHEQNKVPPSHFREGQQNNGENTVVPPCPAKPKQALLFDGTEPPNPAREKDKKNDHGQREPKMQELKMQKKRATKNSVRFLISVDNERPDFESMPICINVKLVLS